jgi:hypothetical protein
MPLQIRRGTTAERTSIRPIIGELIYDTTLKQVFVGDSADGGITGTLGGNTVSSFGIEDAQDAVASVLSSGTHTGISFFYDDAANKISATVGGGVVVLDIKGSVFTDDTSTILVDGILGAINLDNTIRSNVIPYVDSTYDLGSASKRFKDLYLSGSSLYVGNAVITATGSAINLPAGSTVGGVAIGSGSGLGDGVVSGSNYNINIVADDSTVLVNSSTGLITAPDGFIGDVVGNLKGDVRAANSAVVLDSGTNGTDAVFTGSVTGNVTGNLTGNVTGNLTGNVTGSLEGDVVGSIFNDNSVLLLSGIDPFISNGIVSISANSITSSSAGSEIVISGSLAVDDTGIRLISNSSAPIIETFLKNTTGSVPTFLSYAHRGTDAAPTVLSSGDSIWSQSWLSYDGSTYTASAALEIQVDTVGSGDTPAKIFLVTIPNNDVSQAKGIQITETGVSINGGFSAPAATLDINGFAKLAVLTAPPATPANGMVAIADGTSWNPTTAPGKQQAVVYLGGGWRQMAIEP